VTYKVRKLHPFFAAELLGADLAREPDGELIRLVEALMAEHAVLVIRDQTHIGDDEHIRFSRAFGPLELPPKLQFTGARLGETARYRPELFDVSNLDERGEIEPADALKRKFARGNELFHTDSSFNDLATKWSLLFSHIVPPFGGDTQFVDTRVGYELLPESIRQQLNDRLVEHNLWRSRERSGFTAVDAIKKSMPAVTHPLVRVSASGRKALYIGAHADHIVGLPLEEGRRLLDELMEIATQPHLIYSHRWVQGDLVIWDNRCTMHRATAFDFMNHKRDLRRTTINEFGEERRAGVVPTM